MIPFLNNVASWLYSNHTNELKNIQLVFPNQRSGVFFLHYFKSSRSINALSAPLWIPKIKTISEFVTDYSDLRLAEPIELLAVLYKVYLLKSSAAESFDNFYSWGELMISDFNDVDKYMVDATTVFSNVKSLKEMEADFQFLSKEQIEVVKRFFSNFNEDNKSELKNKFLKVWEILQPVYQEFRLQLINSRKGYEGLVYQFALDKIKNTNHNDFPFKKVYFVGFNAITPVEELIFENLKNRNLAGFFWDYDDYYIKNKQMESGYFQRKYIVKFPHENGFHLTNELIDSNKKISIVSVPTDHGQVFKASQIIAGLPVAELNETALVLSDEQLLLPALDQIPVNVDTVNVTMGYGIRESMIVQFVDLLINLQTNAKFGNQQSVTFYYKNVIDLLRHSFIQHMDNKMANETIEIITKENLYQIEIVDLPKTTLINSIFKEVTTIAEFEAYVKSNLLLLNQLIWKNYKSGSKLELEKEFGLHIYAKINQLSAQLTAQQLSMQLVTYFKLLRRILKAIRVPFEGEPIGGLQLMGFLETRNIDFKNLIVLSVNEGILPTAAHSASFIPYGLRRGFGLPTRELHDAMYAYYFYRLIQRAKNVWLIYNSGVGGLSTGEKSRFIYQLQYDSNFSLLVENISLSVDVLANTPIVVKKEGIVRSKLLEYLTIENKKVVSPSSLAVYLNCSLRFYFKVIANIHEPDEVEEQVDARLFGNIFHKVAEKIYTDFYNQKILVSKQELEILAKNEHQLDAFIKDSFKNVLRGDKSMRPFKIEGKNHIVFQVIKNFVLKMLEIDGFITPFQIIGLEQRLTTKLDFNSNGIEASVFIGGLIDRIDKTTKSLRIVDYKTGSDKFTFDSLDDVFDAQKIAKTKAVFQTFIYSYVVSKNFPSESIIVPTIYQLKNFFVNDQDFSVSSKDALYVAENFNNVSLFVENKLKDLMSEIFNMNIPFTQTDDLKRCIYCPFKEICGR